MSDAVAMSFKARMNNLAKEKGLRPQLVIQNFMFERFLDRLSTSSFRDNFVIKGGVLISSIVGIQARTTMDVDTTLIGLPITFKSIRTAVAKICKVDAGDEVDFSVLGIERIRLQIEGYGGIRVKMIARYHGLQVPFAVDVTDGDVKAVDYSYRCQFMPDRTLQLRAYSIETVLAEKCEAILRRNVVGTRPRDYYDVYLLTRTSKVDRSAFVEALKSTCESCGTKSVLDEIATTLSAISESAIQHEYWRRFQAEFPYAESISFNEAVKSVGKLLESLK